MYVYIYKCDMDEKESHNNRNPVLNANVFSRTMLWWLLPLFRKGYAKTLAADDLFNACPSDQSASLGDQLEREWRKEINRTEHGKTKPSLARILVQMFGKEYLFLGILLVIREAAKIVQPLILGRLILYFALESPVTYTEAYLYAFMMSLCGLVMVLTFHLYVYHVMMLGMRMRLACCSLMYRKLLRLSTDGISKTTSGQIVNLMSNDVGKFDYEMPQSQHTDQPTVPRRRDTEHYKPHVSKRTLKGFVRLMYLILGPIDAIVIHVLLWQNLGISVLSGFAVLLLLVPAQILMGNLVSKFRRQIAKYTDKRVGLMSEIIAGIQVIKMHCWEKPFAERVASIRRLETDQVRHLGYVRGIGSGPLFISAKLMALAVFVTYSLTGGDFTAVPVFVALSMYESTRMSMTAYVCYAITQASEVFISIQRIQEFLILPEIEYSKSLRNNDGVTTTGNDGVTTTGESCVEVKGVTAKWSESSENLTLKNIWLDVRERNLIAVLGSVGAGKSSLLMTILGELPITEGKMNVKGRIAYVSQQPWEFSATLRHNITLGNYFVQDKYEQIIKACALNKDISMMPHGDMTLIGDHGVRLSGGQKARVSLARALYLEGDIYLLDDPLSAVDSAVGRHIFKHVINGLLKEKPKILVSHQLQFLKYADEIIILKKGEIYKNGTFDELSQCGVDFALLLDNNKVPEESMTAELDHIFSTTPKLTRNRRYSRQESGMSINEDAAIFHGDSEYDKEIQESEERHKGIVDWKVYFSYLRAGAGIIKSMGFILLCLCVATSYVMNDFWLTYWSQRKEQSHITIRNTSQTVSNGNATVMFSFELEDKYYILVYSALVCGVFLFELIRSLVFYWVAIAASQNLHNRMLTSLIGTDIGFFILNPIGRILNRFSKDVGQIDDRIPDLFFNIIQCGMTILSMVVVVGIINPWTFIPVLPICVVLVLLRRYFLRTSRDIKRLEGIARSPVYSHLSATFDGLRTIRASRAQERLASEFDRHQDTHTEAWFLLTATTTWLKMNLDFLSALFLTVVTFACVLASDSLGPGLVGLTLTYTITGTGIFQWTVTSSADLETQMISVERVSDYCTLPAEQKFCEMNDSPPKTWPQHAGISAENLSVRYSIHSPTVLKNMSFTVKPKEKVGIVGRSGAGKSSLITALFRLVEPEGQLKIDGINIQSLDLHDLRSSMSIIPQEPMLFKAKLRCNLDPLKDHDDSVLWEVLKAVELNEAVAELPQGLDTELSDGGTNFSIGQRQLVCLARALLQGNKILVIDEATANVDIRTDQFIQHTISEKFQDCTVLTVAHRLNTVIDSDRLMVIDDGRIVEFDIPYLLLNKPEGYLYKMVKQTGSDEALHLMEEAKTTYETKLKNRAVANECIDLYKDNKDDINYCVSISKEHMTVNSAFEETDIIITRL